MWSYRKADWNCDSNYDSNGNDNDDDYHNGEDVNDSAGRWIEYL